MISLRERARQDRRGKDLLRVNNDLSGPRIRKEGVERVRERKKGERANGERGRDLKEKKTK